MEIFLFFTSIIVLGFQTTDTCVRPDDCPISEEPVEYSIHIDEFNPTANMSELNPFSKRNSVSTTDIEPGILPEGDGFTGITYSRDGARVFVSNGMSQNISVVNWATQMLDTTFSVGGRPYETCCTDEYIVVPVQQPMSVNVYKLSDYSLAASFPVSQGMPWIARASADGKFAYVGIRNTSECLVIDLSTLTSPLIIPKFTLFNIFVSITNRENFRQILDVPDFVVTPDGKYLVAGGKNINFFNTSTGTIDHMIDIRHCTGVSLSGDGKYAVARSDFMPVAYVKINLTTFKVESTVVLEDGITMGCLDIAVNQDGSKALVSSDQNVSFLLRFDTDDYVKFYGTSSPSCISSNHDNTLAVTDGVKVAVVDFETETVTAAINGIRAYFSQPSPVENEITSISPLGYEEIRRYVFSNSSLKQTDTVMSGSPVEADGSRRVAISPDGSTAVISNTTSQNISILNMQTRSIDAIIDIGGKAHNTAITSDSKWAVVCGGTSNQVEIINLKTNTIVASVPTGANCVTVSITPDDSHAYVVCTGSGVVSVIKLDGASSTKVTDIQCKGINGSGAAIMNCGIYNNVQISPDGSMCIVAAATEDMVRVIDTATNKVVASLAVGNFPLRLCFNSDGSRALVSNFADDTYSLLSIDGASSSVITTRPSGDRPTWVAYDPFADQFALAIYQDGKVITVDTNTGLKVDEYKYPSYVLDLAYTATGERLVLVFTSGGSYWMYKNADRLKIDSFPVFFDYSAVANTVISVAPGPDYITCISYGATEISQQNIALTSGVPQLAVSPNPGADHFAFHISLPSTSYVDLAVYDLNGRKISSIQGNTFTEGSHSFSWSTELPTGVYAIKLDACEKSVTRRFTVCR